jgi:hypothetical protein
MRGSIATRIGILSWTVLALLPATARAAKLPVVAVAELDARGIQTSEAGTIADNLTVQLQQSGRFRVMERSQIAKILREQNFQSSGACDGSECAVELGKILGIDRMVVGSVGKVGATYSLNLRLVDVATGEALRTTVRNHKGTIDEVLVDLVPLAANDLSDPGAPQGRKSSIWPWVAGGSVLVGGGVAAAILLSGSGGGGTTSDMSQDHLKFTW